MAGVKRISVLGATGSVGMQTKDVLLSLPSDSYDVQVVTANNNVKALAKIAIELDVKHAVIANESHYQELKNLLAGTSTEVLAGKDAVSDAASIPADWTMAAIVGMAGLEPVMKALEQGTHVAIANKEPLVSAGTLVMETARKFDATILPVDSEHNAVFQVFDHKEKDHIEKIILTASGGPFRDAALEDMEAATPEQAVAHPNWSMGQKISVDSATMMNKALEVIEAHYLFDMPPEKIDVVVHPQSIVHSMVEYADGSVLAQLGAPDMRTPIAYSLAWPKRMKTPGQRLDIHTLKQLEFRSVDSQRFPSVDLAYQCLKNGQLYCLAMNAANEIAVEAFLKREIGFLDIYAIIEKILDRLDNMELPPLSGLDEIIKCDMSVRKQTRRYIEGLNQKQAHSRHMKG